MARQIEVWYDETSDSDEPIWCVSLCEEDGEEIKCLATYDDRDEAIEAGRRAAAKRSIEASERSVHGQTSSI